MARLKCPDVGAAVIYNDSGVEYGARVVPPKGYTWDSDDGRVDLVYRDDEWIAEGQQDGMKIKLPDGKLHVVKKGRDIPATAVPHESRVDPGEGVRFWRYPDGA